MSYKLYRDNGNFKIRKDGESFLIGDNLILSPTPTTTPTPTISVTSTATPIATTTSTPTISVTATVTPTLSITPTPTYTPGASSTPISTITATPTSSVSQTPTPSTSSIISIFKTSNTANYSSCASWNSLGGNITTVGSNGNSSTYSIYDMAGGIYEWTERIWFSSNRGLKGGTWTSDSTRLNRSFEAYQPPTFTSNLVGFRVATIAPSPYIEYGIVGDINNENDSAGIGSVSYEFKMGKFEITNTEYVEFLNSIAVTDTYGAYSTLMNDPRGGVLRSGSNGSYVYAIKTNYQNKPVICVNWYNAARYCNWLQNGKPSGIQDNATTENGAYQLTGNTGFSTREFGATYFIPNGNEWQKAAFYKGGSTTAGYWDYATQSNTAPTCISANSVGDGVL